MSLEQMARKDSLDQELRSDRMDEGDRRFCDLRDRFERRRVELVRMEPDRRKAERRALGWDDGGRAEGEAAGGDR